MHIFEIISTAQEFVEEKFNEFEKNKSIAKMKKTPDLFIGQPCMWTISDLFKKPLAYGNFNHKILFL